VGTAKVAMVRSTAKARTADRLKWAMCAVLVVALAVALAIGASRPSPSPSPSPARRAAAIDASLRCPSCDDISVADSSAATAVAIRELVAQRVRAGETTAQIDDFLESRYGTSILLDPPSSGLSAAVWIVPLVAAGLALAVLGVFFWRRRQVEQVSVADADRAIVEAALTGTRAEVPR
jgi:cytochrome c-type biogenesis protein CcmH